MVARPPTNVNAMVGEWIAPAQVMVDEMVFASEDNDDDIRDEQELFWPKSESEWLFSLEIVLPCSSLIHVYVAWNWLW